MSDSLPPTWVEAVEAVPGSGKPDPVLVVDNVMRRFGGLTAVDVKHVEIQRGAITALIGPNGAGKTTFFNLLTGFDSPDSGSWVYRPRSDNGGGYQEKKLENMSAHNVARGGVVRTFQLTKALSRLTVMENMKLGATGQAGESMLKAVFRSLWRDQERDIEDRAVALLERFKLIDKRDDWAGTLSGGQRKLLEMARALMVQPQVIMLDEPMAGVNPALTQSLLGHVKELRADGMTVVFVEHDMDVVYDISDWVVVMAEGSIISEGVPQAIGQDRRVIDAYLGAHHDAPLSDEEEERQLAAAQEALEDNGQVQ